MRAQFAEYAVSGTIRSVCADSNIHLFDKSFFVVYSHRSNVAIPSTVVPYNVPTFALQGQNLDLDRVDSKNLTVNLAFTFLSLDTSVAVTGLLSNYETI